MTENQSVRNVPASLFISMYADFLKKSGRVELPSWLNIVKTGNNKVNSPENPNWYFYRLAALSRKFYLNRGKGIGNLRKDYGGKKRRGSRPGKRVLSSGKILRLAIQQLEKLNIIYQDDHGKRKITKKAKQDMDKRAGKIISLFA
jgi:small subunit ribosomal protein S19e